MKQFVLMGSAAAMLLGMSAPGLAAEHPSWDHLSLEWVVGGDIDIEGDKEGVDGYRLEAAKGFGDFAFVRAVSNAYHVDIGAVDESLDFATQQLGVGIHYALGAGTMSFDPWASLNYERVSLIGLVGTGAGVDIGVRAMIMPAFEVGAYGKVFGDIDFGGGDDADYTGYTIYGAFAVVPKVAIQASFSNYELDFDPGKLKYKDVFALGVRLMY